ncbi:hypothetical protein VBD025_02830 [Virgibacillus flavescens]|uniref:hypothetical protein n=1 Tax=Virgibacillus flavescens TaxID=1611422 RepID=UPI003D353CDA
MLCKCGGLLVVTKVEEYPEDLSSKEKLHYNRVCDVECMWCGNTLYSQSYDDGALLNIVKKITEES